MPKKLALIPALALAIAGLGAAPAVASPADADTSLSAPVAATTPDTAADETPSSDDAAPAAPAPETTDTDADDTPAPEAPETPAPDDSATGSDESDDEVTEDPEPTETASAPIAATVDVEPGTMTESEFYFDGVIITVSGLEPGDIVTNSLTDDVKKAKGSSVEFEYYDEEGTIEGPQTVDFTVTVERKDQAPEEFPGSFVITEDEEFEEGSLTLGTDSMSVSAFMKKGISFTGEGFVPGEQAIAVAAKFETDEIIYLDENVEVSDEGVVSGVIRPTETDEVKPGDYIVYVGGEEFGSTAEFTLTADAAQDASLSVSPKSIEAADFVKKDKGVTLSVKDCKPGSDVRFVVNPKGNSNVTAFDSTVTVDETGTASVNVYGTSANASAYVGDYSVSATCGDDVLKGPFEVTSGAAAGGSGGSDSGSGSTGGQLPRTGAELSALAGGAALLLVGGAVVALTVRRRKSAESL
ncbi:MULTISPECIES: hypothetical protein [unclassified Brevibacterium]|uniref:hypothetical protein n=1 Tax=unclassified Brevibacterium TaxID=2614124 RepID=UPI0010F518CC|nr:MULTISPECIES: hypothetical protein [unclassified Brevibacterium]MCM1011263.1 hypothetical protein [Brevibacterium sp. XM4083]